MIKSQFLFNFCVWEKERNCRHQKMEILWRNFHQSKLFSSTEKAKWERVQKDCIHFLQRYGFVDLVQASNLGPTNLSCWDHFTPPLQTGPVKTAPENVVATIVVFAAAFYAL